VATTDVAPPSIVTALVAPEDVDFNSTLRSPVPPEIVTVLPTRALSTTATDEPPPIEIAPAVPAFAVIVTLTAPVDEEATC
jgi:hypothetical protein